MLYAIPTYSEVKQSKIILAAAALHNFIVDHGLGDDDANDWSDEDEEKDGHEEADRQGDVLVDGEEENAGGEQSEPVHEDVNMNALREQIANQCMHIGYQRRGRLW